MRDFLTWDEIELVAQQLVERWQQAQVLPTVPEFVSIDFDFFAQVPRFEDDPFIETWQDHWGCGDETRTSQEHDERWLRLAKALHDAGADPEQCVQIAKPHPQDLLAQFKPDRVWISNSHVWAAAIVRALHLACGQKIRVFSLDAHHDLGYHNEDGDTPTKVRRAAHQKVTCDNWLLGCLERGYIEHATILYPDWKEDSEWSQTDPPLHRRKHRPRIEALTWSQFHGDLPVKATLGLFRSSEWLPPWSGLDDVFAQCARHVSGSATMSVIAEHVEHWPYVGSHDPLTPRAFSLS